MQRCGPCDVARCIAAGRSARPAAACLRGAMLPAARCRCRVAMLRKAKVATACCDAASSLMSILRPARFLLHAVWFACCVLQGSTLHAVPCTFLAAVACCEIRCCLLCLLHAVCCRLALLLPTVCCSFLVAWWNVVFCMVYVVFCKAVCCAWCTLPVATLSFVHAACCLLHPPLCASHVARGRSKSHAAMLQPVWFACRMPK